MNEHAHTCTTLSLSHSQPTLGHRIHREVESAHAFVLAYLTGSLAVKNPDWLASSVVLVVVVMMATMMVMMLRTSTYTYIYLI